MLDCARHHRNAAGPALSGCCRAVHLLLAGLAACSLAACPEFPEYLLLEPIREGGPQEAAVHDGPRAETMRRDASDGPVDEWANLDGRADLDGRPDRDDVRPRDLLQPDTGCLGPPDWWDVDYALRRRLTVTEAVSGSLTPGYSLALHLDTRGVITGGELLSSGDDLRVVYQGAGGHQELRTPPDRSRQRRHQDMVQEPASARRI